MEVAFYNESNSSLHQEVEIYHAFVFSLIADSIHLHCHNSTLYNLHVGNHQWSDQKLRELFELFQEYTQGELELERDKMETILTNMSKLKKIKHKNKTENRLIDQGIGFKKKLKEMFEILLKNILTDNRMFGLQSVIDSNIVKVHDKLSVCPDKHENKYIQELVNVFRDNKLYQVFGDSVLSTFRMLRFKSACSKWLPGWIKRRYNSIGIEILNLPLICELDPDQLLYLRQQLYPEFGEFKNQLNRFREAISTLQFRYADFTRITDLFNQHIANLRQSLQLKIDQQLHIQFMRNNFGDFGLKLFLVIAPVSKMIEYYNKSGIVPNEVSDAIRRSLEREMDLNRCDVFFHVTIISNLKRKGKGDRKKHQPGLSCF